MAFPKLKRKRDAAFRSSHEPSSSRIPRHTLGEEGSSQTRNTGIQSSTTADVSCEDRIQEDTEQNSDEDIDTVIMAIDMKDRGTLGCCYYAVREEKLYIFADARVADTTIIETSWSLPCMLEY